MLRNYFINVNLDYFYRNLIVSDLIWQRSLEKVIYFLWTEFTFCLIRSISKHTSFRSFWYTDKKINHVSKRASLSTWCNPPKDVDECRWEIFSSGTIFFRICDFPKLIKAVKYIVFYRQMCKAVVLMVKWSAYSPSTPPIRVQIPLKSRYRTFIV